MSVRWAALGLAGVALAAAVGLVGWWLAQVLTWRSEWVLWGLASVPVLCAWLVATWLVRQRAYRRFGDPGTVKRLLVGRSGGLRATRSTLLVAAVTFSIIAVAGPQYGSRTRTLRKRGVDVVVALDFSKSMLARDVRPDRITRAKAELTQFVRELHGDRVGVVAFAGETIEFPMTTDYAAIALFLRELGPYDMPVGGTAIGRALTASQRLLERSAPTRTATDEAADAEVRERAQVVVLLTDGEDHEGDPLEAARQLSEAGIRLYTVGIGSRTGEPIPTYADDGTWTGYLRDSDGSAVTTSLTAENEQQLRQMAELTDGEYFRAERGGVGVDQIRREIRRMKQSELDTRQVTITEDRFALAALPAFLLLLLETLLPEAWVGRRRRRAGREPA